MSDIVSCQWLAAHMDCAILDCSWHLPSAKRDAKAEFVGGHIPGAQFFDIDEIADTASPLPHMLPSSEMFAARVGKLGVGDTTKVVVYDAAGLFSAARVWWMLKVFGHDDVAVLDGGLPKWKREGRPLAQGVAPARERHFTARLRPEMVKALADMRGASQIADARSAPRFRGEEAEPRPGVRPGHIPGARNVHYASLLKADGTLQGPDEIAAVFAAAGIDLARPVITSCGSGVTAAILSLGLTLAGTQSHALYDGSWAEWGAAKDTEVATGSN